MDPMAHDFQNPFLIFSLHFLYLNFYSISTPLRASAV